MKKENFEELLESVKEAGQILRGEKEPSRKFTLEIPDIKPQRDEGFSICVETDDPALVTPMKVYRTWFLKGGKVRIIDEEDEAAIYPAEFFIRLNIPSDVESVLKNLQKAA